MITLRAPNGVIRMGGAKVYATKLRTADRRVRPVHPDGTISRTYSPQAPLEGRSQTDSHKVTAHNDSLSIIPIHHKGLLKYVCWSDAVPSLDGCAFPACIRPCSGTKSNATRCETMELTRSMGQEQPQR